MKRRRILLVIIGLMAAAGTLIVMQNRISATGQTAPNEAPTQLAVSYLKSQYDQHLLLMRESPVTAPNMYWIATDNRLAEKALQETGNGNMAEVLRKSADSYSPLPHGLIEVLDGKTVSWPPHTEKRILLAHDGSRDIWTEAKVDGKVFTDWQQYADLTLYGALNELNAGNRGEALNRYHEAMALFNGVGFADKTFVADGTYATYKVALALFTAKALNQPTDALRTVLLSKQAESGGFYALYAADGAPLNDTNTETTSLGILALTRK